LIQAFFRARDISVGQANHFMQHLRSILEWFSGGALQYHKLSMCMQGDKFWISITVILDLMVAMGYVIIAYHWSRNERALKESPARVALRTMRNIFVFCGICGYLFIPVKMFWPAWRLYDFVMLGLVFYTWRYALNALNLKVIYTAIGKSSQLAEDLARSQDESRRKTFFLNAISHDLRTPLNGLLLHANLAEIHVSSGDQSAVQQAIGEIKASVRLTADLLDGLLEYARLETGSDHAVASAFSLDELLREVISTHAPLAARKSLLLGVAPVTGITLNTDRLRLERILNNLVGNAIKFTMAGSVHLEVQSSSHQIEIHVIDTGIGIAPEHQRRLFEEFFQVQNHERDRQKGFGLGLAISNRLAHQIGGELRVQSTFGNGSQFTIACPATLPHGRTEVLAGKQSVQHAQGNGQPAGAAG
jgi:signal transduction histidine kinase